MATYQRLTDEQRMKIIDLANELGGYRIMREYTVVGIYTENDQKFCGYVEAASPLDAAHAARNRPNVDGGLLIVAVFAGWLPALDSGQYAT